MNYTEPRCGHGWKAFQDDFRNIAFNPLMISLYSFGVIFNSLSVAIFAKNKTSSSNILFTSLAISDLIVSVLGVPFWWFFLKPKSGSTSGEHSSTWSLIGHHYLKMLRLFFNVSVLHTATLAVWRFIAVTYPLKERKWCTLKNTIIAIVFLYVFCILYETATLICPNHAADVLLLKNASSAGKNTTADTNVPASTVSNITEERTEKNTIADTNVPAPAISNITEERTEKNTTADTNVTAVMVSNVTEEITGKNSTADTNVLVPTISNITEEMTVKNSTADTNVTTFMVSNTTEEITGKNTTADKNITKERTPSLQVDVNRFLCVIPDYLYVIVVRIVPSIIVIVCSCRLTYVLQNSRKRREELMPNVQTDLAKDVEKDKQMNRTTRMLLGIMILFLLDKVASATVKILIILYDNNFIRDCLPAIAQMISILSLIYVATPFVVYYVSSQQFRDGFKSLFAFEEFRIWYDKEVSTRIHTESTHL